MLKDGERLDSLLWRDLKIIQKPEWFCFSIDAVLLSRFVSLKQGDRVMDLGTGTGVIPLLLFARSRKINITGLEITPGVAEMARRTMAVNGLENTISIIDGDLKSASTQFGKGRFDLVTCNPPYARASTGRVSASDVKAAARTEILCSLGDVVREGAALLNSEGRLAMVHRPARLTDILFFMRTYGVEPKRLQMVCPLPGKEPNLVLVEGIKNGRKDLLQYPPLYVYEHPGCYSPEMIRIFSGDFLPEEW